MPYKKIYFCIRNIILYKKNLSKSHVKQSYTHTISVLTEFINIGNLFLFKYYYLLCICVIIVIWLLVFVFY